MERDKIYHFIYGRPCSGKTEAMQKLTKEYPVSYISVGTVTRKEVSSGSSLGKQLQVFLDAVQEYPPELITQVMEQHVLNAPTPVIILDGFPKYGRETISFKSLSTRHNLHLDIAVVINLSLEEAIKRAGLRRICPNCEDTFSLHHHKIETCPSCSIVLIQRDDDTPDALARRFRDFDDYTRQSFPILKEMGLRIIEVDGAQSRDKLADTLATAFKLKSPQPG